MDKISGIWSRVQRSLFPYLEECLPELSDRHRKLALVLETVRVEDNISYDCVQRLGRKPKNRIILARAFVAKALYNATDSKSFIERLKTDRTLRQICGWQRCSDIPSESTFSRAFAEFADSALVDDVHKSCVEKYLSDELIWHISRDSTQIDAREKPLKKPEKQPEPKRRRGRPKADEIRPKPEPTRIERQLIQTYSEAIAQLPVACDFGTKKDSKGSKRHWVGYKLHLDISDGGIPISALTTSASVHDSQVAIPLSRMTADRVVSLYELMDSAYDVKAIHQAIRELGHVPIISPHAGYRKSNFVPLEPDRAVRYNNRTTAERFNSRLKDEFGGRMVRVRGKPKVHTHLMFGVLAIFALSILNLAV